MDKPRSDDLTLMDAVDNLSSLSELDISKENRWVDPKRQDKNRESIKATFRVLHSYLKHLYEQEQERLQDPETQRGIQAMMVLAGEAAQKLDKFSGLFKGVVAKDSVTHLEEYKQLQQFYLSKLSRRFEESLKTEEAWQKEWEGLAPDAFDIQRRGLKDLETVRKDREYELFYIRKEDGHPFFNANLLRHIRLVGSFDETMSDPAGDDPLMRIKTIQDREMHASAKEILHFARNYIDEFYKEAMRHKEQEFVAALLKAVMGLMLAANPRNLIENAVGKSCVSYFTDFHAFLREALRSEEYQKMAAHPPDVSEHFPHTLYNLCAALSAFLFMRAPAPAESQRLIHRLISQGEVAIGHKLKEGLPFWASLLDQDEEIRSLLKRYPNGPLLKTLDAFREDQENQGFDPILQDNLPSELYDLLYGDLHATSLHLPCPVRQTTINHAAVVEEFKAFLRYLSSQVKKERHLLINLQDRTGWQEHARSIVLEELSEKSEYSASIVVVTLPKATDFYLQAESYASLDEAPLFTAQLKEQVASVEECGFYFPPQLKTREMKEFVDQTIEMIHRRFFEGKASLSRKERLDFIEIFYQFLILKLIDFFQPDSFSLTCKDALDVGAAANAAFFSFLRLFSSSEPLMAEEKDFILWMLQAPALLVRQRPIDPPRLHRAVSALATVQLHLDISRKAILDDCAALFENDIFKEMRVEPSK